ncbi:hypothetical protein NSK_007155 [Nannochloropsis salina CCMP1776]|uniref:CTP synthase (glutamine hydrolyzing) n=1 Tax=Nannochloropsis salina CCMP1776 TaxID=1027361 RepID=A0A4D9CSK2_9STRA|nr:hypothetical protein NSK_007155 [Nannochloropsis salina CCMP1776]|eukprot:TFJ81514.1 hypothetical protein NSK_007155 [Nannochloropsis salina CCMP1776]
MERLRLPSPVDGRLEEAKEDARLLQQWETVANTVDDPSLPSVRIAVVGKYTGLRDSYLSIEKALQHAAIATRQHLQAVFLESSSPSLLASLQEGDFHALLVPGGFGTRGLDGKVGAIRWARESKIPFLGICLGMQAAVIEYARSVLGRSAATSTEFVSPSAPALMEGKEDVVIFMPEGDKARMGGTMRLGARTTLLQPHSLVHRLYAEHLGAGGREAEEGGGGGGGVLEVDERHRHRYEVNPDVVSDLEAAGLRFVGKDRTGQRMEILELGETTEERRNGRQGHPFFAAVQFHPEFKSRPTAPSPLFLGLLRAASRERERRARGEKGSQGAKERVAPSMDEG